MATQTRYDWGGQWLGFERVTRVPIQTSLVDLDLMSKEQTRWLREHNKQVYDDLLPLLNRPGDEAARKWLKRTCK
jgi:Xaa-Pro aminopeptidase